MDEFWCYTMGVNKREKPLKTYYLRYESDGNYYNDDKMPESLLDKVSSELDDILPHPSVSYNEVIVHKDKIIIDGGYEEVSTFVPLNEEELGGETTDYVITLER